MFSCISKHTSEPGVGNTGPLPTAIPHACAPHHVPHVMLFIPLVSNAIHDAFFGCTDFFMGCLEMDGKHTLDKKRSYGYERQAVSSAQFGVLGTLTWKESHVPQRNLRAAL